MNAQNIDLPSLAKLSERDARAMLERLRWPNGPVCPHCGVIDEATKLESADETEHKVRDGVWNCRACRKPFSVTVGTIFEGSHIPISKWLIGFYLFASSKKSLSALQLQRQLALGSYRSAWHMAHRIRHAMGNYPNPPKLKGTVEADEVYIGGRIRRHAYSRAEERASDKQGSAQRRRVAQIAAAEKKISVAVLVTRDGEARAKAMKKATCKQVSEFIKANVDVNASELHSD